MFWIPAHTMFELALIGALVMAWSLPEARFRLLVALISHAVMRVWSLVDFVPKALAFERADPATITESTARRWTAIYAPESILLTGHGGICIGRNRTQACCC